MSIPGFVTGPSAGRATEPVVVPQVDHGITLNGVFNVAYESLSPHFGKPCDVDCIWDEFSSYHRSKLGPYHVSLILNQCC